MIPDPWPLHRLVVRTPRLELRPDDDPGLAELVELAYAGVHPPDEMPFAIPWTDADPAHLGGGMVRHFWSQRAAVRPDDWNVNFLVRLDRRVIGTQGMSGTDFGITREVETGSWLGRRHQGRGLGTEARAAVLGLAFDGLGARTARSGAFTDNPASRTVSAKLGYREDGTETLARRGRPADKIRLLVTAEEFDRHRPRWRPEITGLAACLPLLGAT